MTILPIPATLTDTTFTATPGTYTMPNAKTAVNGTVIVNLTGCTFTDGNGTAGLLNVKNGATLTCNGGTFNLPSTVSGLFAIASGASASITINDLTSTNVKKLVAGQNALSSSIVYLNNVVASGLVYGVDAIASIEIDTCTLTGGGSDPNPFGVHIAQDSAKTLLWVSGVHLRVVNSTVTGFVSNQTGGFRQGDSLLVETTCESVFIDNCILGHNSDSGGLDFKGNFGTIQNCTIQSDGGRAIAAHTNGPGGGLKSVNNTIYVNNVNTPDGGSTQAYVCAGTLESTGDHVSLVGGSRLINAIVTTSPGSGAPGSYPRVGHATFNNLKTLTGANLNSPVVITPSGGFTPTVVFNVIDALLAATGHLSVSANFFTKLIASSALDVTPLSFYPGTEIDFVANPIDVPVAFAMDFEVIHPIQRTEPITPLRSHRMQMHAYRLRKGIPQDVPMFDISGKSLFTSAANGAVAFRPAQLEIDTSSDYRWIGTETYYDVTNRVWFPIQAQNEYVFRTNSTYFPGLNDTYSYFVGQEYLTFSSVSFTEARSDHFWSDFRGGLDSSTEYTVIIVAAFRPPTGANTTGVTRPFYGIWDGGRQPTGTGTFTESTGDRSIVSMFYDGLHLEYQGQGEIDVLGADAALNNNRPVIITLSASSTIISLEMLAKGGTRVSTEMELDDSYVLYNFEFLLGRPNGTDDPVFCANMEIFDICFYGRSLDQNTRHTIAALLDGVYGVTAS